MQAETWSHIYQYPVANDIRIAAMTLAKHIPSNITIAGHNVLVSFDGQSMTCYRCNETGHLHQACPMRRRDGETVHTATATSWADIAAQGAGVTRKDREAVEEGTKRRVHTELQER